MAVVTAASSMLLASSAMAADQKIAVVNFQEVMTKIPQYAAMMQSLEAEFKDQKAELAKLEEDIKYLQQKKKRDSALMSDKEKENLDKEMATKFQEYQAKGKAFQQQTSVRQNEETNKIVALVRQAIDATAAKEKFDLVVEQKAVLFSKPDVSITADIIDQVSKLK